jgi:hypothetical protein
VCENDLDGILFNYISPTTDQFVKCHNCIFNGHIEDVDSSFPCLPSGFWYCNWQTGKTVSGQGNNSLDPYFADEDYHLDGDISELIDIGNYNLSNGLLFDMEGDNRKIEITHDETDIGADEYDPDGQG